MSGSYDDKLLEYYLGKSVPVLNNTHSKYKCYAEKLSEKCESVRKQIDELYEDLKISKRLFNNARFAGRQMDVKERQFERGKNPPLPWCGRDEEYEDDLMDDIDAAVKTEKDLESLKEELKQLRQVDKLLRSVWITIAKTHTLEDAVALLDTYKDVKERDVHVDEEHTVPDLREKEEQLRLWMAMMDAKKTALEHFLKKVRESETTETTTLESLDPVPTKLDEWKARHKELLDRLKASLEVKRVEPEPEKP